MTTFFTSDTHFGHARIIELSNRPFASVEEMNEALVENWNSVVGPEDTVYHLGDVALGKIAESLPIVRRLNGRKILMLGNHDRPFMEAEQERRYQRKENPEKVQKYHDRKVEWFGIYEEAFAEVWPSDTVRIGSRDVALSHFPYDGDSHGEDRHRWARLQDNGQILIHGHTHSTQKVTHSANGTLQIHVGVDAWGYTPVSEEAVLMLIQGFTSIWNYPKEEADGRDD